MPHNTTFIEQQISSTRTVFDILWSCLFVIFTCTWTVQHLNVPEQREERDPGVKGDIKWSLKNLWTSTKWMCITILGPEVLITLNLGQLIEAWRTLDQLKKYSVEDKVPWTLTHSLFANMGGFVIREYAPERTNVCCLRPHLEAGSEGKEEMKTRDQEEIRTGEILEECVGLESASPPVIENRSEEDLEEQPKTQKSTFLLAHDILILREQRTIKLPCITREEIMDKGKTDSFARLLAIGQTLWLVIQMLVRASKHLEVSQLEIGTAAWVNCAITIYALNWHKPKGVGVPWTIWSYPGPIPNDVATVLDAKKLRNDWVVLGILKVFPRKSREVRGSSIPNHHRYQGRSQGVSAKELELFGFIFSSTAFGAIHFAAVKSTFPTHIEKVLWSVASAICTGVLLLILLGGFSAMLRICLFGVSKRSGRTDSVDKVFIYFFIVLYIAARLFLIVELFRCLFFLPPSAFVATWVSSIPHVS
jgi:hypothetical protein